MMEAFGMYLLKSTIWLSGFGLIFLLFLRNERYFLTNRIYLLAGILASLFFPFLNWHYTVEIPIFPEHLSNQLRLQVLARAQPFPFVRAGLFFSYLLGSLYLFFRTLRQTIQVLEVIRKSGKQPLTSVKLIRTSAYPVSFSFFSFVFVNPSINDTETAEIVNHEREHVRQKHWMDLVLFELLRLQQWFNPMIWLYGRFIRQNHEYLADERALQRSANPAVYRAALLNQMLGGPVIVLGNSFNYSLNTKRFNMMKNKFTSPVRKLKLLLVVPFVAVVFYAFATPEYTFVVPSENNPIVKENKELTIQTDTTSATAKKSKSAATDETTKHKLRQDSIVAVKAEKFKKYQTAHPALIVADGVIKPNMKIDDIAADNIKSVNVLKGEAATKKYGDKGKDGVIEITTKGQATYVVRSDNQYNTVEDKKSESSNQNVNVSTNLNVNESKVENIKIRAMDHQPLIVIDGIVSPNQNLGSIAPNEIESIHVLKDQTAKIKYGDKGKNGVLEIRLKNNQSTLDANSKERVTVVGYPIKSTLNKAENSSKNGSITVAGYGSQKARYQSDSANYQKKTNIFYSDNVSVQGTATDQPQDKNGNVKLKLNAVRPLLVINGTIADDQNVGAVSPEDIESINVLKDKSATDAYGDKGQNGVVMLTLKKGKSVGVGTSAGESSAVAGKISRDVADQKLYLESQLNQISGGEHKPLIVKDGVVAKDQNIKEFGTKETIEKMTILSGKEALDKYGEKGRYGVIELITKK